jgi:hypothetical protein
VWISGWNSACLAFGRPWVQSPEPLFREITSWDTGHWGRLAGSNVYHAGTDPAESKGWALRTKKPPVIFPCKQVTEAESKAQTTGGCMKLHWLFYFPSAMWHSCFNSFSCISLLCHPIPLSPQNTACFYSSPPAWYTATM